ncbi:uncharacterized protein LOC141684824 isoform X2 [Apium graveolens]|uniref:uncharacterized protein LOC141684824 isoform X2 n=1 Tax=Apium graveolens TaxID=4045 RepID=UPI003D7A269B
MLLYSPCSEWVVQVKVESVCKYTNSIIQTVKQVDVNAPSWLHVFALQILLSLTSQWTILSQVIFIEANKSALRERSSRNVDIIQHTIWRYSIVHIVFSLDKVTDLALARDNQNEYVQYRGSGAEASWSLMRLLGC